MFEKDREFVRAQVLRVMGDWGVAPSGRGSGEGDVENWIDYIVQNKGWEPYWEDERMPREFRANGHTKGQPVLVPVPEGDPYMVKLNAIHVDVRTLLAKLARYF